MTLRAIVRGLTEGSSSAAPELVQYVCTVHRLAMGTAFVAFDPDRGLEADAHLSTEGERTMLHVRAVRLGAVVATRALALVQGFAKGDKCDAIVRDATELGATVVLVAAMDRSIARPSDAKLALRQDRWRRIAGEAARQCGRGDAPRVAAFASLDAALSDLAPDTAGFVLWERATTPLGPELARALESKRPLAFVIGPEGGLAEAEVDRCRARGFEPFSLGPFILRTETVAAAVLGAVRVLDGI